MTNQTILSPSLVASQGNAGASGSPATELKFAISPDVAETLEKWANKRLTCDPHANPETGGYQVTTVYLDTPELDIFRRTPGFAGSKYRLRRYGLSPHAHAEHKSRGSGRVWKRREAITPPVSEWPEDRLPQGLPDWFSAAISQGAFQPVCAITYQRLAYLGDSASGPVRVTLDRKAFARATHDCRLAPVLPTSPEVADLLSGAAIVELKHIGPLPRIFREIITGFGLVTPGPSKYRRAVERLGISSQAGNSTD